MGAKLWRSLALMVLTSSLLPQPQEIVTATSIRSDAVLSSNLCRLLELEQPHCSSLPTAFAVLLLGKSATLRPQQNQPPRPTTFQRERSSALEFWTRAESDHETIDGNLKKGVDVKLSDDGNIDDSLSESSEHSIGGDIISTDCNHSQISVETNATDIVIDNSTNLQDITTSTDISTTQSKKSRWKLLLSSIPGVHPGKPLFMRFMPIRSSEIISRIMEENPVENDVHVKVNGEIEVLELEQSDLQQKDSESSSSNVDGKQYSREKEGQEDEIIFDQRANETGVNSQQESSSIDLPLSSETSSIETTYKTDLQGHKKIKRRRFFQRKSKRLKNESTAESNKNALLTKLELDCPVIATNIHELQSAVLINNVPLKDVGFRFPFKGVGSEVVLGSENDTIGANITSGKASNLHHTLEKGTVFLRDDPVINGSLSSLLTYDAKSSSDPDTVANYQLGIELINLHPVLSIVRERVKTKSKPGDRLQGAAPSGDTIPHLALVIEGGGMRGAVSAGMAAALSTLDLLDAFDSIHGSSAGAIVGAYLVSRQLCTDVYTDIMPAAGSQFASKRRGMVNFGVDYLGDLIKRKVLISSPEEESDEDQAADGFCVVNDEMPQDENITSGWCEDDDFSSVELAMGRIAEKQTRRVRWSDDHYDGVLLESAKYLFSGAKSSVFKPLSVGVRRLGRALRPALSALDVASSLRQYLRKRPGMNLTYVLDGIMDETHGLRPFDVDAFEANDKRQPLYIIASAVSNGGKGEMETVAFNSKDGDFFGLEQENNTPSKESVSWYSRIWMMFKSVPYSVVSATRKAFSSDAIDFFQPAKDALETEIIPAGTNAMYGFTNRHKVRRLSRPQEDKAYDPTGRINDDDGKKGIFPCLEASMLVPGAAGPPIQLIRSKNRRFIEQRSRFPRFRPRQELNRRKEINSHLCCDAFCYEPIPYRSAVEKANATHVLTLRSRPDGCIVETRQHMYERIVGPIYFRKHGMLAVAKLFSTGGSQYRYIEDALTLNEGLAQGIAVGRNDVSFASEQYAKGVKVPPTALFFGNDMAESVVDRDEWKRAHLLPITLPYGTPELPTLSQDKEEVLRAVRNGYAAAYDVLAPVAGLPFDTSTITGEKVAQLLFPDGYDDIAVLNKPIKVKPSYIGEAEEETKRRSFAAWITRKREAKRKAKDEINSHPDGALARRVSRRSSSFHETDQYV
ncbi:hypothetical protein ACHAXR_006139, partial [Thalassiosira sp. AJA248-18]